MWYLCTCGTTQTLLSKQINTEHCVKRSRSGIDSVCSRRSDSSSSCCLSAAERRWLWISQTCRMKDHKDKWWSRGGVFEIFRLPVSVFNGHVWWIYRILSRSLLELAFVWCCWSSVETIFFVSSPCCSISPCSDLLSPVNGNKSAAKVKFCSKCRTQSKLPPAPCPAMIEPIFAPAWRN